MSVSTPASAAPAARRWPRRMIIGVAALALLALAISSLFADGGAHTLDRQIMLLLRNPQALNDPLGPAWFEDVMRDMTGLGGIGVVIGGSALLAGYLWLQRRRMDVLILAGSVAGAQIVSAVSKLLVSRPRPDLVSHEAEIYSASFPSGHTLMATVTWVTFAMLLAADFQDRRVRDYLLLVAWIVAIAVGCSRIYLGVHWPSDVLAGWAIGALWMIILSRLVPRLRGQ
ncbi:undecaprenyl-diphosphatase [Tahibacter aquaticus]|uniref:undecaprenyl-diphosphate phosphatase n=1 Tax=Tahibacter aquaticus TaxID=520092 RepID=A0A4R6Z2I7_9GAMM|nr:phosphatase PAP2 family protein [Tahibacter aquaticus]TDR45801.1 undecaprenyl-diphosphatase [Tahibacter aquaticus]